MSLRGKLCATAQLRTATPPCLPDPFANVRPAGLQKKLQLHAHTSIMRLSHATLASKDVP